jgi:hypothetical protein
MMRGVPLKTCLAFDKLWNNKFYYEAASCWYFYWVIHDARIHEYQIVHAVRNVKSYRQNHIMGKTALQMVTL